MALNTLVIGLGRQARNGKDTVARFIYEKYGKDCGGEYKIAITPFALALKREANEAAVKYGGFMNLMQAMYDTPKAFGLAAPPQLEDGTYVTLDKNPDMSDPLCPMGKHRLLLQWWGTEYRRKVDPNYWVKKLTAYLQQTQPSIALVPDMRFPNEARWVKSLGGDTVLVQRTGWENPPELNSHYSERALLDWKFDHEIHCEDNLDALRTCAYELFDLVMAPHVRVVPEHPLVQVHIHGAESHA